MGESPMRVIAFRVSLLACVLAILGAELLSAPLVLLAAALAVVGLGACVAALLGISP